LDGAAAPDRRAGLLRRRSAAASRLRALGAVRSDAALRADRADAVLRPAAARPGFDGARGRGAGAVPRPRAGRAVRAHPDQPEAAGLDREVHSAAGDGAAVAARDRLAAQERLAGASPELAAQPEAAGLRGRAAWTAGAAPHGLLRAGGGGDVVGG